MSKPNTSPKILLICNQGEHRSRTGAEMLIKAVHDAEYVGLWNEKPISESMIKRADIIFVMEERQANELQKRFPYCKNKTTINLDIHDIYCYNHPDLVQILKQRIETVSGIRF